MGLCLLDAFDWSDELAADGTLVAVAAELP